MRPAPAPARFPALALPALDGGVRDLSRVDRPTLVSLGHGECPTTRLLLPYVERIHRGRRPGTDVVVVLQDTPADARALAADLALSAPILLDEPPFSLGAALQAHTVPLSLLVAPGGRIERAWPAFRRQDLEEAAALLGVPPPLFAPDDPAPALRPG
ncbi:MAG TPA: hypothetical protein VMT87_17520 [Vicinamibacteria bacterium]|nr:hypothetical protein [Vicinamibacteria bacterium]